MIEFTAQLEQIPEELDSQVDVSHVLRVASQTRVQLESNSVPTFVSLIKGVNHCEAVKGIVLKVKFLVALTGKDHEESKFSELFKVKVLECSLFLEERHNH